MPGGCGTLLEQHEDTAWFLDKVLVDAPDHRPSCNQSGYRTRGGIASSLGDNCPVCGDYGWYRPDVGSLVPGCRTDDVPLTQA